MKTPEVTAQPPRRLQTTFHTISGSQLLSKAALRPLTLENALLSKGILEQHGSLKTVSHTLKPMSLKLEPHLIKPKSLGSATSLGITSPLSSTNLREGMHSIGSLQTKNKLLSSSVPSSLLQSTSRMHLELSKVSTTSHCARASPLTSVVGKGRDQTVPAWERGASFSKTGPALSELFRDAVKERRETKGVEDLVEEGMDETMPLYAISDWAGEAEPVRKHLTKKGLTAFKECSPKQEDAFQETKLLLINTVCCSLISGPKYLDLDDTGRKHLIDISRDVTEQDPEFLLKVALYTRQELNIRTTANFLLALAAWFPATRPYLRRYFCAAVRLPSDWMEVAKLYQSIAGNDKKLVPLPSCLRRAMTDKFKQFDEYQLAKYNTRKQRCKHYTKNVQVQDKDATRMQTWKKLRCLKTIFCSFVDRRESALAKATQLKQQKQETQKKNKSFTLKKLIRRLHIKEPAYHVMCLLGRRYPSDLSTFSNSRLPGPWDAQRAGKRMKLVEPETWERQLSLRGNVKQVWEELIDHQKLPFMAMLRNLRNIIKSGVSEHHHQQILDRLTDEKSVIRSRQFPFRFLSAYKVLMELENRLKKRVKSIPSNQEILRKIFKNINLENKQVAQRIKWHVWTRQELRAAMTIPDIYRMLKQEKQSLQEMSKRVPYDSRLLQRYRDALERAVQISSEHNVPPLPGRTVILCSMDAHMDKPCSDARDLFCPRKKTEEAEEKTAITNLEVALLLSLMVHHASEDAQLVFFNSMSYAEAEVHSGPLLGNIDPLLEDAEAALENGEEKDLSSFLLELFVRKVKVDTVLLISTRTEHHDFRKAVELYRCRLYPKMVFIELGLTMPKHMQRRQSSEHINDVKLFGFSDQILRFVAERGASRLLDHVGKIDEIYKLPEPQGKVKKQRTMDTAPFPLLTTPKLRWRIVRVFISSTFCDMHGERDLLIRSVFPELRARAAQLFINVQEVDLRWGITEEEERNDRLLELCLSEVSRSQFLIGILGERYGHVPQCSSVPALPQFEWIKTYPRDRSVTELEMTQFLQQSQQNKQKAFFYFRDPAFLRSVPEKCLSHFEAESMEAKRKMSDLKNQAQLNGVIVYDGYPCEWGGVASGKPFVKGLEDFGSRVLRDLWNAIQNDFSQEEESDSEESVEETLQQAFQESQQHQCYGRKKALIATSARIQESRKGGLFVISGGPSEGKTVFLAALVGVLMSSSTTSRKKSSKSQDVLFHFTSASRTARNVENMLSRFCVALNQRLKREAVSPISYRGLVSEFQFLLERISQSVPRRTMMLLIDGADCLETSTGQPTSDWIPEHLPQNITLVLSVTADSSLHHSLMKRPDAVICELLPLEPLDKSEVVRKTLAAYGKKLEESAFNNQMRMLITKKESRHPLYLKVSSEELRTFGVFEKVSERIRDFPPTLRQLLQHVLSCLEKEHEDVELVTCTLTALYLSKEGLREQDLYAILNMCNTLPKGSYSASWEEAMQAGRNPGSSVPMARFSNLMRSLKSVIGVWASTESPGSRLCLLNSHLRSTVKQRYLKRQGLERQVHLLLAAHLWKITDPEESRTFRQCDPEALPDLPFHLVHSGELDRLGKLLTNIHFLYVHHQLGLLSHLLEVYSLYFTSLPEASNAGGNVQGKPSPSDVEIYRDFIQRNCSILTHNPLLFWQQVLNEPNTSPIFVQGRKAKGKHKQQSLSAEGDDPQVHTMKWMNKPCSLSKRSSKQMGIPSTPTCISVSTNGRLAAIGTSEGYLHILDTDSSQEVRSLVSDCDGISNCVFLSDGYLCSTSFDGRIEIWNILDGCRILNLEAHRDRITECAPSPDRKQLATVSWDRKLKVWSIIGGRLIVAFSHRFPINSVAFHPHGQLIATGGWDRTLRLWHLLKSACVSEFYGHKASIRALSYTPAGDFLASASLDGEVRLMCTATGFTVGSYQAHRGSVDVAKFICDGRYLVTAGSDYQVRVWSGSLGQSCGIYSTGNPSPALCVSVSPQGRFIAVGYHSENVKVYDMTSGDLVAECDIPKVAVQCLAWLHGDTILASGSDDKLLRVWQVQEGRASCIRVLRGHQGPLLALTPTPNFLASASDDCTVHLWSMNDLTRQQDSNEVSPVAVLRSNSAGVTCCAFQPQRQELVTGSKDKSLSFWNLKTLCSPTLCRSLLSCHKDWITGCAWVVDFVASCSNDCTIRLWDSNNGDCLREFLGHQGPVTSVSTMDDYLVSVSTDGTLRVWTAAGAAVSSIPAHSVRINQCTIFRKSHPQLLEKEDAGEKETWQPEELMVATASDDGIVRTWRPLLAEEVCTLAGHSGPVCAAAVMDTLPFFLTVAEDKTLRMWDIPQGKGVDSTVCHRGEVTAFAWSLCGNFLVSGSETGELVVWQSIRPVYRVQVSNYQITGIIFASQKTLVVSSDDKKLSTWELNHSPSKKSVCLKFKSCLEVKTLVTCLGVCRSWKWMLLGDSEGVLTVHKGNSVSRSSPNFNSFCAQLLETKAGDLWVLYHPRTPILETVVPKENWDHTCETLTYLVPWDSREDLETWMTAVKPLDPGFSVVASDSVGRFWIEDAEESERIGERKGSRYAFTTGLLQKWKQKQAHHEMITALCVTDNVIITASRDCSVKLWDCSSLKQVGMFLCQGPVSCMELSPTCPWVIVCGDVLGNVYFINWQNVTSS